jgi:hypothetical protein
VDVLQRVTIQPQARVEELTPRLWKHHFAGTPLGSWIDSWARRAMRVNDIAA